jgi:hypothetical protein
MHTSPRAPPSLRSFACGPRALARTPLSLSLLAPLSSEERWWCPRRVGRGVGGGGESVGGERASDGRRRRLGATVWDKTGPMASRRRAKSERASERGKNERVFQRRISSPPAPHLFSRPATPPPPRSFSLAPARPRSTRSSSSPPPPAKPPRPFSPPLLPASKHTHTHKHPLLLLLLLKQQEALALFTACPPPACAPPPVARRRPSGPSWSAGCRAPTP